MTTVVAAFATTRTVDWLAGGGAAGQLSLPDVLAQNNFGDTRSGGLAGPLGLFIVVLLAIAMVLLVRNMNARLKRLPKQFPPPSDSTHGQVADRKAVSDEPGAGGGKPTTT